MIPTGDDRGVTDQLGNCSVIAYIYNFLKNISRQFNVYFLLISRGQVEYGSDQTLSFELKNTDTTIHNNYFLSGCEFCTNLYLQTRVPTYHVYICTYRYYKLLVISWDGGGGK